MGGPQHGVEQAQINRSACSLLSRVGDDMKEAIYTCAGCGATKRGFSGWRNHMKKATKFNKKSDPVPPVKPAVLAAAAADPAFGRRRGNASTNPRPTEAAAAAPRAVPAVAAPPSAASKDHTRLDAKREKPAEMAPPQPSTRPAASDADSGPDGKRQRVRGPGNEARRLAHAEKVRAREAAGAGREPKPK
jgi:hypothetical protein